VSITGEGTMQLRHISPRSIDWMDAMDEGAGGRGWEKLAPEERAKLLRDRQGGRQVAGQAAEQEAGSDGWGLSAERRPARAAGYFATASPSK
jgi:hypothetical protein